MFRIFCAEIRTEFFLISGYPHNATLYSLSLETIKPYKQAAYMLYRFAGKPAWGLL
jgi:hypothetical protein